MSDLISLRSEEFNRVKRYFYPGAHVLELGGGNGFQASLIHSLGANVKSIDVAKPAHEKPFFDVQIYDGFNIPFPNASFDIVFSSNVLEHVRHINIMMSEMRRVLKRDGIAIHILPTPTWRFWTTVSHYPYLGIRVLGISRPVAGGHVPLLSEKIRRSGFWGTLKRVLIPGPHGEYPSAISELWYFSKTRWFGVFRENGFHVVDNRPSGLFYTGYAVTGQSLSARQKLAKILGSSTRIYVLQNRDRGGQENLTEPLPHHPACGSAPGG